MVVWKQYSIFAMATKFCWSFPYWKCVADTEERSWEKNPKNVAELREKIQESQHILTSAMRSNLMNSVSVRLNEVISSKGKQIRL